MATTSSDAKCERLAELGALPSALLTDGRGADRVIEVGGPVTIGQSLHAIAVGEEVALIGS